MNNPLGFIYFGLYHLSIVYSPSCIGPYVPSYKKRYQGSSQLWVVGNITVGGNHKTPCVLALLSFCHLHRVRVGIVMHGYGAVQKARCYEVSSTDLPLDVGDEALWIKQQGGVPVVIAKRRREGIVYLKERHPDLDIIVCDDGMQDSSLMPDVTFALYADDQAPINRHCLPAGPFRESLAGLSRADWVLTHLDNRWLDLDNQVPMIFEPIGFFHQKKHYPLDHFKGRRMHAMAAIAHPGRFFRTLESLGIEVIPHAFPDHHVWRRSDFEGLGEEPILMTSKDAIKMADFEDLIVYVLDMRLHLDERLEKYLWHQIRLMD